MEEAYACARDVAKQDFATLDGISNGRAEIMVGRGSFVESFPLFSYDLKDYEALFDEKLYFIAEAARVGEADLERESPSSDN